MDSEVAGAGARSTRPRPYLFGIASVPYGAFNGLVAVALPYLLRRHGVSVERIAGISATVQLPAIWYFLWAPVVDVRLRRRTWVVMLSVASGVCAGAALAQNMAVSIRVVTALLVVASVLNQPVSSAIGGLVASVMPNALRGRTGGWSQAGILGGGVLAGGLAVWSSEHLVRAMTATLAALVIAVPSFAVLAVDEPHSARSDLRAHLMRMVRDVVAMFQRREVWLGLLFFVSPIGAGALMNLFSAVASDFHAPPATVLWVVVAAGILTPAGALAAGVACDRFDRWRVYPVAGLLQAATVVVMRFAPLTPATYIAGAAAYAVATGFCYGAFMALAFELLGAGAAASGTEFTLFMAAANIPVVYMLRLDGAAHAHYGVRGMLAVDGGATAAFGLIFLVGTTLVRKPGFLGR